MTKPAQVAASVSVRQRSGWRMANSCAAAPPQDTPNTSACATPRWSSSPVASRATRRSRYGSGGAGESPTPGASKATTRACSKPAMKGSAVSMLAPMPLNTSTVRAASAGPATM
jgi:hypothetical protein